MSVKNHQKKRLFTRREAALELSIVTRTLDRLITAGEIKVVRIGKSTRLTSAALDTFIEAREAYQTRSGRKAQGEKF